MVDVGELSVDSDVQINNWWNLCVPGKSLDWSKVNIRFPTVCLNTAIVGAPRCDVLVLRDKPNKFLKDALERMFELRPILVIYHDDKGRTPLAWDNYLKRNIKPAEPGAMPDSDFKNQPADIHRIKWTRFDWVKREVAINPGKGIFTAIIYVAQHTKLIRLYGCDMQGKGYHDPNITVRPQRWENRWKEEKKTMVKMFKALRRQGIFMSGLPQKFLVENDLT